MGGYHEGASVKFQVFWKQFLADGGTLLEIKKKNQRKICGFKNLFRENDLRNFGKNLGFIEEKLGEIKVGLRINFRKIFFQKYTILLKHD